MVTKGDTKGLALEYHVPVSRFLAETNGWLPAAAPFPPVLSECSKRAANYLRETRRLKGDLTRFTLSAYLSMHSFDAQGNPGVGMQVERWVLTFTFSPDEWPTGANEATFRVVMLLDGTIAEERLIRGSIGLAVPRR